MYLHMICTSICSFWWSNHLLIYSFIDLFIYLFVISIHVSVTPWPSDQDVYKPVWYKNRWTNKQTKKERNWWNNKYIHMYAYIYNRSFDENFRFFHAESPRRTTLGLVASDEPGARVQEFGLGKERTNWWTNWWTNEVRYEKMG